MSYGVSRTPLAYDWVGALRWADAQSLFVPMCTKLIQKSSEWHLLRRHWSSVKDMVRAIVFRYATTRRTGTSLTLTHQMNIISPNISRLRM